MNFEIFEDQKQIKILIKKFCQKELNEEYLKEIEMRITRAKTKEEIRKLFPWHLLDKLHEIGIRQLAIPQKYGGTAPEQQVNITLTLAAEEIGYWGGNLVGIVMIPWIFLRAIAIDKTINEDQRKWIFQKFVQDSRFLIATAVGEASSCTDIHYPYDEGGSAILKCKGFKEDGCWIIDGEKAYCSGGAVAHLIMVAVRTNPEGPVSEAMSFFWIPTNLPGVTITPHQMLATDLGGNCQIYLNNVKVSEDYVLGEINKGFSIIKSFFDSHLPGIAGLVGAMRRIYEHMREYAKQRRAGGKSLIEHPNVALKLGEIASDLEALRNLMYRAAWEIDVAQSSSNYKHNLFWYSATYAFFKKISWHFCNLATDIYGGMSAAKELPLGEFMKHIFYVRAAGLTFDINRLIACRDYEGRYQRGV